MKPTDTVLEQAKLLCKDWAEGNGKHKGTFDKYISQKFGEMALAEKQDKLKK